MKENKTYVVKAPFGESLDSICFRVYGGIQGFWKKLLAANPGIAEQGDVIPYGTRVVLPNMPKEEKKKSVVRLWE